MGRITNALRNLCETLGVPTTGKGKAELIESIADNYTGGNVPQATSSALGGVKADPKQSGDTQPVRIGTDGKLYTAQGDGMLVVKATVNFDTSVVTLDKTFAEISEAVPNVVIENKDGDSSFYYNIGEITPTGALYFYKTEVSEDGIYQSMIYVDDSGADYRESVYPTPEE